MALRWAGRLLSNVRDFYSDMNPATLNGAIDVIVIRQENGSFMSSGWHVRFGKMGVLMPKQNVVDIEINGKPVDLNMRLGVMGEAFFVQESTVSIKNDVINAGTFDDNDDDIDLFWKNRCETPPEKTNSISSDEEHFIKSSRPVNKYLKGLLVSDLSSSCPNVAQSFPVNTDFSNDYKVITFNSTSDDDMNLIDPSLVKIEINAEQSNQCDIDRVVYNKVEFSIEPIGSANIRRHSSDEFLKNNSNERLDKSRDLQKVLDEEIFELEMDDNLDRKDIARKNESSASLTKYNSSPELNDLSVDSVLDPYYNGITIGSLPEKKSESWMSQRNPKKKKVPTATLR